MKGGIGFCDLFRRWSHIIRPPALGRRGVGVDHHLDSGLSWMSTATGALCWALHVLTC